jgi:hypothetical protein
MRLELKTSVLGRQSLSYDCPHCETGLTSPLDDAGKDDTCPDCGESFAVPGSDERDKFRADEAHRRQQRELEKQRKAKATRTVAGNVLPYVAWFALLGGSPAANWVTDKLDPAVAAHAKDEIEYKAASAECDATIEKLNQTTVYHTSYGYAYHRRYHYAGRNSAIGLADAVRIYSPCATCNPPYTKLPERPEKPTLKRSLGWRTAGWVMWLGMIAAPLGTLYGLSIQEKREQGK